MKQETQQCSTSPLMTSQTFVDDSPTPMCVDSPGKLSRIVHSKNPEEVHTPPYSVTSKTCSSADYPSSMKYEASTSFEPDYKLQFEPRDYQNELAKPGIEGKNYIIVAPTGCGKTLVAAIIISKHLRKLQDSDDVGKVVFLVNTKPLADQQREALRKHIRGARVECIVGDSICTIKEALKQNDIVVCTAGKFLDELNQDMVSLLFTGNASTESEKARISLLIMDECHHARKESVQVKVMHRYITEMSENQLARFPQVVGLTASPGAGDNPDLDITKTIDHLVNLCALLDATGGIITVKENVHELAKFVNPPELNRASVQKRHESDEFIQFVEKEMYKLENFVSPINPSVPKCSQQYETLVNQQLQPLELSTNPDFRDKISTLKLLLRFNLILSIYMDLRREDALKVLREFNDLPDSEDKSTIHEQQLQLNLIALIQKLENVKPVENPLLQKAKEVINEQFQKNPESRGIFFVRTKRHAFAVCEWLQQTDDNTKPIVITGHKGEIGMTQADQKAAMESFRSGTSNILVATSVAEEGLDVPTCNFIIRFQHVSNEIASTQTQGRARAEESEVTLILSNDSPMNMKEIQNTERLELVNRIVHNSWIPTGTILVEKIKEQQKIIIKKIEFKKYLESLKCRSAMKGDRVTLKCRKCKEEACSGSDIFTFGTAASHYVVPGAFIKNRLIKKPHHAPDQIPSCPSVFKTHKIYCKNCDTDWGVMCSWPNEGHEFPVLKCKYFSFEINGCHTILVPKWSKAPFEILPLELWFSELSNNTL